MSSAATEQPGTFAFSADNLAAAKAFVAKYPDGYQASAVLPLLDLAQRQNDGWLPQAASMIIEAPSSDSFPALIVLAPRIDCASQHSSRSDLSVAA